MTPTVAPLTAQIDVQSQLALRRISFAAACGAALLGVLILFGVGFSHPTVAHNAAHDARHAQGFPCH
jgi:cobalt transporter subunit CbtB